ncbi:type II secretion system F family protein [Bacillus sp. NPDC094106]|uniref:type II secretion system F family protein n=1 Tax=Bacillus sp. NPDC094106 TaxID=3363949 RepID=UPI003812EA48
MEYALVVFTVFMLALIFISTKDKMKEDKSVLHMRKSQSSSKLRENALKLKLERMVETKAKVATKHTVETMCLQAGYKFTYGEFKLMSFTSAIVFPIFTLVMTSNPMLSALFILVGYMIPGQFISFIRNRRLSMIEEQVGSFINLVVERYKAQSDFPKSVRECLEDFKGQEPMYSEIKQTVLDMELGVPTTDAMDNLARRTGNKYLERFSNYYQIATTLGTEDARENLLGEAFQQYEENRKMKATLKKEISGPVREGYIMVAAIPMLISYQIATSDSYVDFMLHTTVGKVGSTVICAIIMGSIWFINKKIGAPLD